MVQKWKAFYAKNVEIAFLLAQEHLVSTSTCSLTLLCHADKLRSLD